MTTEEASLASIRQRINAAQQVEARNAVLRERSEREQEQALALLKEKFGVASLEDANDLKTKLETQLSEVIKEAENALNSLEG